MGNPVPDWGAVAALLRESHAVHIESSRDLYCSFKFSPHSMTFLFRVHLTSTRAAVEPYVLLWKMERGMLFFKHWARLTRFPFMKDFVYEIKDVIGSE